MTLTPVILGSIFKFVLCLCLRVRHYKMYDLAVLILGLLKNLFVKCSSLFPNPPVTKKAKYEISLTTVMSASFSGKSNVCA
jgi:hypothetical protein